VSPFRPATGVGSSVVAIPLEFDPARRDDFVDRAGSCLCEPPDSVHTLYVLPNDEITETLSVVYAETQYFDAKGAVSHVSNGDEFEDVLSGGV
jgi:hypothetical protein